MDDFRKKAERNILKKKYLKLANKKLQMLFYNSLIEDVMSLFNQLSRVCTQFYSTHLPQIMFLSAEYKPSLHTRSTPSVLVFSFYSVLRFISKTTSIIVQRLVGYSSESDVEIVLLMGIEKKLNIKPSYSVTETRSPNNMWWKNIPTRTISKFSVMLLICTSAIIYI